MLNELPAPIGMKGNNLVPYNLQLFIVLKGSNKHDIIKHVKFVDGTRVLRSAILRMCHGQALQVDLQGKFREGGRALQYMLEGLGGFQVRYQKLVPAGSSNKQPLETADIRKGFDLSRGRRRTPRVSSPLGQKNR